MTCQQKHGQKEPSQNRLPGQWGRLLSSELRGRRTGPSGACWGVPAHSLPEHPMVSLCVQVAPNHAVSSISLCAYTSKGPLVPPRPAKSRATQSRGSGGQAPGHPQGRSVLVVPPLAP